MFSLDLVIFYCNILTFAREVLDSLVICLVWTEYVLYTVPYSIGNDLTMMETLHSTMPQSDVLRHTTAASNKLESSLVATETTNNSRH